MVSWQSHPLIDGQQFRCTDFWDLGYTDFTVNTVVRVAYEPNIAEVLHDLGKVRTMVCRPHPLTRCFACLYADQVPLLGPPEVIQDPFLLGM